MRARLPEDPGLGPKSIALLFEHFQIQTMDELEQLCRDQKLRTLPRMGAKLEEKVLRSIMQYKERSGRFLLSFADNTAKELTAWLSGVEGSKRLPGGKSAARQGDHWRSGSSRHGTECGGGSGTRGGASESAGSAGARR